MPSLFSQNLGIELPADGELDGIWGDVVNTNMRILDRAINGQVTLTLSGTSSTLTTSDGTLSDGQFALLILAGSPSGTHTITIAPNDARKIYLIRNTTSQSVVFTQGSGGNATVLAGASAVVASDGAGAGAEVVNFTNTLAATNVNFTGGTLSGVTITNPSLTGGTIDNTPIGATTRSTGAFTTLAANGAATLSGGTTMSGTTQINGQLGLNGTNYGTAGQVLTSAGAGNPPTWANSFPSGGIILWSGSIASIPAGWALCDGTNGTPNLRDRFVIGAGSTYAVGATGGSTTKTIAEANLPAHTHGAGTLTTNSTGSHTHTQIYYQQTASTGQSAAGANQAGAATANYPTTNTGSAGTHSHTISGSTASTGSGTALDIMPPYYALAYIMKL